MENQSHVSTADIATRSSMERQPTTDGTPVERQPADKVDTAGRQVLFPGTESESFRTRWSEVQTGFVDEPRRAVEEADALVAEVMQRLAQVFASERSRLEQQWDRGADTDTEALRLAMRRYRSFFDRLLTM